MVVRAFPVLYSTLSSQALVTEVLPRYDIGTVCSCRFWHRGLSDVYLIETQASSYILRVSHAHWRSEAEIGFELEFLDFLQQQRLPVAYPLRTRDDRLFIALQAPEGWRYASLFIYAPGEVPSGDLNVTQSYCLGRTLAQIHQCSQGFKSHYQRSDLDCDYLLTRSLNLLAPFFRQRPQDWQYLLQLEQTLQQILQDFPREAPYWCVCWGDAHSGNTHFTTDQQVTLFDFDQCGYGWRMFEIAKFWQVAIRTGMRRTVREAFLDGYRSQSSLPDPELALLQPLTQLAHIWMWAINLESAMLHEYSRLGDFYFTNRLQQLKRFANQDWQLF